VSDAWIAAAILLACAGVSALWGIPSGALQLGTWVGAFGAGVAVVRLGRARAVRAARFVALLGGGGASLAAAVAFLGGGRGFSLHGGQGNPNWLGLLVCASLPLAIEALAVALRAKPPRRSAVTAALTGAVVLVEGAGLLLSHSRVAWGAAAAAAVVLVVAGGRRSQRARRVVALAGAGAALLVAFATASAGRSDRDAISDDVPASVSLHGRAHIWRCSLLAAEQALPFGAGLGRFAHSFLDTQGRVLGALSPAAAARRFANATTAHDDALELAVEAGPIAALFFVAFVVLAVRDALRARWAAGAATLVAFGVASLGDSPLHQPAVVILVALVTAGLPARRRLKAPRTVLRLAALAGFVLVAGLLAVSTRAWLGTRARTLADDRVGPARIAALARSLAIDPTAGETLLDLGLAELTAGDADRALLHLDRSRALLANVGTDVAVGDALLALGDAPSASRSFRAALLRYSGSLRARAGLAEALRIERRFDEAEHEAEIARSLAPGDPVVRDLVDRIHEARMDDEAADVSE
jgi:O-antigen ligase